MLVNKGKQCDQRGHYLLQSGSVEVCYTSDDQKTKYCNKRENHFYILYAKFIYRQKLDENCVFTHFILGQYDISTVLVHSSCTPRSILLIYKFANIFT